MVGETTAGAFRYRGTGTFEVIGNLTGATATIATDASQDGNVVVGRSEAFNGGSQRAFRWTPGGGMVDIGHTRLGNYRTAANAVSADGIRICGFSFGNEGVTDAFLWTTTGGMTILPPLTPGGDFADGDARGMNTAGTIVVGGSGIPKRPVRANHRPGTAREPSERGDAWGK